MNLIAATLQKCGVLSVLERQIDSVQENGRVQAQTCFISPATICRFVRYLCICVVDIDPVTSGF